MLTYLYTREHTYVITTRVLHLLYIALIYMMYDFAYVWYLIHMLYCIAFKHLSISRIELIALECGS